MTTIRKARLHENTKINFNQSVEITYWARKYNMSGEELQKIFSDSGYSISRTLAQVEGAKRKRA